ncbi:hypothetical protein [Tahibacter harae]|uniref:Uncharacterized protein n=1 Tax=Tahibacter harae TaxID=2963937 RepID=A0ABT1QRP8_9GAMM|nr:hypothetical protein [Tahibacter harae]MCQ4164950.1 hypothetical protein [Tahibacter harae]
MQTLSPSAASVPARGSLLAGTGLGLGVLLGGYFLLWQVAPSLQETLPALLFLVLPWLGLGGLAVFLLREGRSRTALGLGVAGLIVLGIVALLIGLVWLLFANSNGWH